MVRGYYTAASGVVTAQKKLNEAANNIANVNTAGYKKSNLVDGTFGEHMAVRMDAYKGSKAVDIGKGVYMNTIVDDYTDYTQGTFTFTQRPMDFAIEGDGFFLIADGEGNLSLTRDGQFSLDDEGYLVLPGFGRVQGDGGDIQIGTSEFEVDRNGFIYAASAPGEEMEQIGRFDIALPQDYDAMRKNQNGMFVSEDYVLLPEEGSVYSAVFQGRIENSNVAIGDEMTRMLSSQRAFQSCSQIVKMYDDLSEQMNTRIPRVQR